MSQKELSYTIQTDSVGEPYLEIRKNVSVVGIIPIDKLLHDIFTYYGASLPHFCIFLHACVRMQEALSHMPDGEQKEILQSIIQELHESLEPFTTFSKTFYNGRNHP